MARALRRRNVQGEGTPEAISEWALAENVMQLSQGGESVRRMDGCSDVWHDADSKPGDQGDLAFTEHAQA